MNTKSDYAPIFKSTLGVGRGGSMVSGKLQLAAAACKRELALTLKMRQNKGGGPFRRKGL